MLQNVKQSLLWAAPMVLFVLSMCLCVGANETQTENANAGTTAWQITNPALNREIEGYASLTSVNAGGSISLFVSTTASSYTMDVFRIGWYGGGARDAADHRADRRLPANARARRQWDVRVQLDQPLCVGHSQQLG
jgi:hypothetical protein